MTDSTSLPADRKTVKPPADQRYGRWKIVAAVAGIAGFLLACLTPLLPVNERTTTLNWPQGGRISNVDAPLVAYAPARMRVSLPCELVNSLPAHGGTLVSTLPDGGLRPSRQGLFIRADQATVTVADRDVPLVSAPRQQVATAPNCRIVFEATGTTTTAGFEGIDGPNTQRTVDDPNLRPQITGVYSDLPANAPITGIEFTANVDARFSTSPTTVKRLAIIIGLLCTVLSMVALGFLDLRDGRGHVRIMPQGWLRPRPVDITVIGVLLLWWFLGPNTSDDGYQFTMGSQAAHSGYMINYFRSFGVPENPFGWNDYLFTAIMHFTSSLPALRVPGTVMGLLSWLIISREMIPRLGPAVRRSQAGIWAGAAGFLLIWLPLNNGLRPEPAVVLFSLLTWVSVERAIATGRLLPVAVAVPCAALTLGAAPGGIIAVAALLAASRQIVTRILKRRKRDGLLPLVAPILASGTAYLFYAFYTPSLAAILEAVKVKNVTGPTLAWYEEGVRYYYLMIDTVDGSVNRRIGVLLAFLCLLTVLTVMLRRKRPSGIAAGPVWRLMAVFFATIVLLAFTPTKWTHHLGLYPGYAAGIAAVAGTMMTPAIMRSKRNRVLFAAAVLYVMAVSFAGINGYYWAGIYGVTWGDTPAQLGGLKIFWLLFAAAIAVTVYGIWLHLRRDYAPEPTRSGRRTVPALAILALLVVLFDVLTVVKGAYVQRGSFSWAASNSRALTGSSCSMADYVLMETDPSKGLLTPLRLPDGRTPTASEALAGRNTGFTPNGVPSSVTPTESNPAHNTDTANVDTADWPTPQPPSVNGSTVPLPFGLDPTLTPILGSQGATGPANLSTDWYSLPARTDRTPLVTMSVAGSVAATGLHGVHKDGRTLKLELGHVGADGVVHPVGAPMVPIDVWAAPNWRNLRFPTAGIPAQVNAARVVIDDPVASPDFVAITPPRLTSMRTADEVLGRDTVIAIDFMVAFAFPCQHQMQAVNGIWEVPQFRISPDYNATVQTTDTWEGWKTGGPLGITDAMLHEQMVPTYLRGSWEIDWGTITRLRPWVAAEPARLQHAEVRRGGMWTPGPMRDAPY
jgi:arabinosyltransferase B